MKTVLSLILLSAIFTTAPAIAENWGPWEVPAAAQKTASGEGYPLQLAIKIFQKYISPIDGPRCPMYPTCSSYALQALRKHGPLLGIFQTVDRLYREGDAKHEHVQTIAKWGFIRFHDPLEENDFWLQQKIGSLDKTNLKP